MRVALLACVLVACGKGETTPKKHDAGVAGEAAVVVLDDLTLGVSELEVFQWRERGGHPAFRTARSAEAREDWQAVVTTCRQALAADPSHLEAAWLLAAALGRQGKHDELLAPLQQAVAGDFGKWGHASLELPALKAFLATPAGTAWTARVDAERSEFVAALARAVIVEAEGDLFAFDPLAKRWHRLTRTFGAVIGALRVTAANKIIYVTKQGAKGKKTFAVGSVDLATGRATRPLELGTTKPISVAYQTKTNPGIWVRIEKKWHRIDERYQLAKLPSSTPRPQGWYIDVRGRKAKQRALPVAEVTADWDDAGLASAIRIGRSNRVVSVPSPGLIDGNSASWSPDRSRLAFVAHLDDHCTPGSISTAAFVADAATGQTQELERAVKGLTVEWLADGKLALAGDNGVVVYDLEANANAKLDGARGLVAPRQRPKCTAKEPEQPDPDIGDPDENVESDVKNP
jgi:hypothetical protein